MEATPDPAPFLDRIKESVNAAVLERAEPMIQAFLAKIDGDYQTIRKVVEAKVRTDVAASLVGMFHASAEVDRFGSILRVIFRGDLKVPEEKDPELGPDGGHPA